MRIPNFKSEEGSILYSNTVGQLISPRVAEVMFSQVTSHLAPDRRQTVLDLGCGPGTVSLALARQFPQLSILAVDASASMLALASQVSSKEQLGNLEFRQMDAGHIDLTSTSFDWVLCNLAFPFFPRPHDSLRELYEVVRPGGQVCFTVPGRNTWSEFFKVADAVMGDFVKMARPFLVKFTQAEVLKDAMSSAGFEHLQEQRIRLPFRFESGQSVLDFFHELFHLLDYAPEDAQSELAEAIDRDHPGGFTMNYEAVLLSGRRPAIQQTSDKEVRLWPGIQ